MTTTQTELAEQPKRIYPEDPTWVEALEYCAEAIREISQEIGADITACEAITLGQIRQRVAETL